MSRSLVPSLRQSDIIVGLLIFIVSAAGAVDRPSYEVAGHPLGAQTPREGKHWGRIVEMTDSKFMSETLKAFNDKAAKQAALIAYTKNTNDPKFEDTLSILGYEFGEAKRIYHELMLNLDAKIAKTNNRDLQAFKKRIENLERRPKINISKRLSLGDAWLKKIEAAQGNVLYSSRMPVISPNP